MHIGEISTCSSYLTSGQLISMPSSVVAIYWTVLVLVLVLWIEATWLLSRKLDMCERLKSLIDLDRPICCVKVAKV